MGFGGEGKKGFPGRKLENQVLLYLLSLYSVTYAAAFLLPENLI